MSEITVDFINVIILLSTILIILVIINMGLKFYISIKEKYETRGKKQEDD